MPMPSLSQRHLGQHQANATRCGEFRVRLQDWLLSFILMILLISDSALLQPGDETTLSAMLDQLVVIKLNGGLGTFMGCS